MTDRTIDWVFRATDRTTAAFRSIDANISGLTRSLKSFAGFAGFATVAAGVGSLATNLVKLGSELQDASERLGVSASQLQVLKYAVEQAGGSFDSLQAALGFNAKLTLAAAKGNKEALETFSQLGIEVKAFAALPIDKRFAAIADRISKISDAGLRLALTYKALGKGAAELVPVLAEGAAKLEEQKKILEAIGAVMTDKQIASLDRAGDAWGTFLAGFKGIAGGTLADILGWFQSATDAVNKFGRAIDSIPRLGDRARAGAPPGLDNYTVPEKIPRRIVTQSRGRSPANEAAAYERDVAAAKKAAEEAAKAIKAANDAAADYAKQVADVTGEIAKLSKEANSYFIDRGRDLAEKYKAPIDTLTDGIKEVNSLFAAGVLGADAAGVANRAIKDLGDAYASAVDTGKQKNTELKDSTKDMFDQLKAATNGYAKDLTDAFFDSTQTIGQYFKNLAETIAKALFTQQVTEPLLSGILGSSAVSGLFGGPRAAGGAVGAGTAYLVGEKGPELFVPRSSGQIVPNGAGGGGTPVHVSLTITSVDPQTAAQTIANQERLITGMIRRATIRAGRQPSLA